MFNFSNDMIPDLAQFLELYYYKILRVNLTTDTYEIVLLRKGEKASTETTLSGLLNEFAESDAVEDKDKTVFKAMTKLEYLRNHVDGEFWFKYGHKVGNSYYKAAFILMPSVNYSEDNQECILFLKEIELSM